jgi:hypothetical protein
MWQWLTNLLAVKGHQVAVVFFCQECSEGLQGSDNTGANFYKDFEYCLKNQGSSSMSLVEKTGGTAPI